MRPLLLLAFSLLVEGAYGQNTVLPTPFNTVFKNLQLDKSYEPSTLLKTIYFQSDFNGDNVQDVAVFVADKKTNKLGVVIIHGNSNNYFVFGAGKKIEGTVFDNLGWASKWSLYTKKTATETQVEEESDNTKRSKETTLLWPGLLIEESEDGEAISGGIIYWTGEKYTWIQQGED